MARGDDARTDGGRDGRDRRRLQVDADLSIRVSPGGRAADEIAADAPDTVDVWSDGGVVTVDAPSFRAARSLLSGLEVLPLSPARIDDELDAAGLTVRVRVRRATVVTLGPDVRPRFRRLSRLIGAPEAAVSPRGVLVGALRRLF